MIRWRPRPTRSSTPRAIATLLAPAMALACAQEPTRLAPLAPVAAPASRDTSRTIRIAMRAVEFHFTRTIAIGVASLDGTLVPRDGDRASMDDKCSFTLAIDRGTITLDDRQLSSILNEQAFADAGAPLRDLRASIREGELVLRGIVSLGTRLPLRFPFTLHARDSLAADGRLMLLGGQLEVGPIAHAERLLARRPFSLASLIPSRRAAGIEMRGNDILIDIDSLMPPPLIRARVRRSSLRAGRIEIELGPEHAGGVPAPASVAGPSGASAGPVVAIRGGTVSFGALVMQPANLRLEPLDDAAQLSFAIDWYHAQLVGGIAAVQQDSSLLVRIPPFRALPSNAAASRSSARTDGTTRQVCGPALSSGARGS